MDNNHHKINTKHLSQGPVIYMYTFTDGTSYIGSTHNERDRYMSHTTDSSNYGIYSKMKLNIPFEYHVLHRFILDFSITDDMVKNMEQSFINIYNPSLNNVHVINGSRSDVNYSVRDKEFGDIVSISQNSCKILAVSDSVQSLAELHDIDKMRIRKCLLNNAGSTDGKYFVSLKTLTDNNQGINVGDMIDRDYLPMNTTHKNTRENKMMIQGKNHKGIQVVYLSIDEFMRKNHSQYEHTHWKHISIKHKLEKYLVRDDMKQNDIDKLNYRYIKSKVGTRMDLGFVKPTNPIICRFNNSCHLIATYADTDEVLEFVPEVENIDDLEICLDDKVYHNDSKSFYMRLPDIAQIIKKNKKIRDFDITLYNKHMYLGLKLPVLDVKKATVVIDINTGKIDEMFDNNIELAEKYGIDINGTNSRIITQMIRNKTITQNQFQLVSYKDVMKQAGNVIRFNFIYDFHK